MPHAVREASRLPDSSSTSAFARELSAAVKTEQDLRDGKYATATASLVEGILGKDHELPAKLRGLRAKLIGNQTPGGTPSPAPAP